MNAIHEYSIDSIEFSTELDSPTTKDVPATILSVGDLILYREYIVNTIDYTENPPKENHIYSGRVILQRIVEHTNDRTVITTIFTGINQ